MTDSHDLAKVYMYVADSPYTSDEHDMCWHSWSVWLSSRAWRNSNSHFPKGKPFLPLLLAGLPRQVRCTLQLFAASYTGTVVYFTPDVGLFYTGQDGIFYTGPCATGNYAFWEWNLCTHITFNIISQWLILLATLSKAKLDKIQWSQRDRLSHLIS